MTIHELKKNLRFIFIPGVEQSITPYIWGRPGIGKSQAVKQIADELGIGFIDLRLSQLESADLRGIPVPDVNEGICRWMPPEFLPFEGVERFKNTSGILLLDEFNRARTDVLQSAFQLVLDRSVGLHKIMDTWYIVAAGNLGEEDQTDVNELDFALKNRFIHFRVDVNFDDWLDWARSANVHEDIVNYLQSRKGDLYPEVNEKNRNTNVFVTPRSWEKFSDILKANAKVDPAEITQSLGKDIISSCAGHFLSYLESKQIISGEDIAVRYTYRAKKDDDGNIEKGSSPIAKKVSSLTRDQVYALKEEVVKYIVEKYKDSTAKEKKTILKNIYYFCGEALEDDLKVAFLQSLARSCSDAKNHFIEDYFEEFNDESKFILKIRQQQNK